MRKRAVSYLLSGLVVLVLFLGMTGLTRADSIVVVTDPSFEDAGLADGVWANSFTP